jgi:hypothetical protein
VRAVLVAGMRYGGHQIVTSRPVVEGHDCAVDGPCSLQLIITPIDRSCVQAVGRGVGPLSLAKAARTAQFGPSIVWAAGMKVKRL